MRILLASSEVHPYSKTGGLADMIGALGKALTYAGHQVGIVTPLYRGIRERFPLLRRMDWSMNLPLAAKWVQGGVWTLNPVENLTIYFIQQPEYFDRAGLYNEHAVDFPDNGERFMFFSKAVVHLARYLPWKPDVLHLNDWQTGLVPAMVLHGARHQGWQDPPGTLFTIHNLAYQGWFPNSCYNLADLPMDYFHGEGAEMFGYLNCLKAGIAFANVVTTVSPRYAREITTEEFGEGLDWLLRKRQSRLFGILNGVDYEEWNTTRNPHLKHSYSATRLAGKMANKAALQQEMGLPVKSGIPLFGTITRLTEQKGINIELGALEEMLNADIQFVLLGSGSDEYERAFQSLAHRFPERVGVRIGYDQGLSHRIEAGCDFYVMPSRFEPCGLNQMYSLRYGTVPIVRVTGGLDDTVVDASADTLKPTGIKFTAFSTVALAKAMRKALVIYQHPKLLKLYRLNGMKTDFSWNRTVKEYERVYELSRAGA